MITCPPQVLTKRQRALFLPLGDSRRQANNRGFEAEADGALHYDEDLTDPVLERAVRKGVCDGDD